MKKNTITIVGGASTYTPGIIKSLIQNHDQLRLKKVILQDINEERLEIMGKFVEIMMKELLPDVEVKWTTERKDAFVDTNFIFVQIRPGGLRMRELDEKVPLKHGLVGQETCGAGGFAFAMRSIPAILQIVEDALKYAPDAWILNYSNPESMVSEAVQRVYPEAKVLCLCDMPISEELSLAKVLGIPHKELTFRYFGLNHFGWFTNIFDKKGQDLLPELRKNVLNGSIDSFTHEDIQSDPYWRDTFHNIVKGIKYFPEHIPITYLQYYFFPDEMVEKENPEYTRANYVMDYREKDVFNECKDVIAQGSINGSSLVAGVHGNYIIDVAKALINNTRERFIINVKNNGSISNFSNDAIVEVPCYVSSFGVEPIVIGKIPTFYKGLMEIEKSYEILAVEAILENSYDKALQALTSNLTIPSAGKAKAVLDDLIIANEGYFPELKHVVY